MNACIDTYFIKVDRKYTVIHDKMFDFLCSYFGKTLLTPILKYADDKVICERVQLESLQKAHGYFTIMVSAKDEHEYNDRIKTDLENGKIHCCLNNMQMKYKEYRIKFRDIIKDLEYGLVRNLIKMKDENGINSFIISCLRGYDELVDLFISVGADVDSQIGFFTPLTAACHDGHLQTVEILLKKGSDINNTYTQGETPLYTACFEGHYNLVNRHIDKEADINKQNRFSSTPLHASCMMGHASIVRLLIDKGANVFQYKDLLITATLGGNDKIVELILSKGCCLNSVDIAGKTALFIACEEGNTNIEKLLIDNNADIYIVDSDGRTPLHAACCVGNNDIVRMLVNKNADVNMLDVDLETPLHKSCRKGSVDVILTLLDNGADTNQENKDGHTPVHLAKTEGKIVNESILKALGEEEVGPYRGASMAVSKNDKCQIQITACTSNSVGDDWTPLYQACVLGDIETVQSLIRYGASVNMQTISGEIPLIAACQHGYGFLMQTLLDERADINQALVCAVQKDYDRAVKFLLYKGGDLGYKGVDGKSLIKLACEHSSIKAIKILSEKDADFTEIDVNGRTLIHVACNTNSVELIQFLIDKGLDLGIPDKYGRFALFVSIDKGFYDLSIYLVQKNVL
ncbi:ankyrin-1-like [Mytilus trossulus]|uniref:ankyrin-1-like n=1 Tax=Mytilus trossulus TaxID=6551 RepID=UPI003003C624